MRPNRCRGISVPNSGEILLAGEMAKMAIVVVALCLVGLSQSSVVNLTLESADVFKKVESINERQGEERIGSLLDSLESKMARLSGPRSNEVDDLLRNLKEVRDEYNNFEDLCRISQAEMRSAKEENDNLVQQILNILKGEFNEPTTMNPTTMNPGNPTQRGDIELIDKIKALIRKKEEEIAILKQTLNCTERPDLTKEIEKLKEQLQNGTQQLTQALENITRLTNEKNELQAENAKIMNECLEIATKNNKEQSALQATIRDLSAEKQQLLDRNTNLTQTLSNTLQQLDKCLSKGNESDSCNAINVELDKESLIAELKQNLTKLTEENKNLLDDNAALAKQLNQTSQQLQKCSQEHPEDNIVCNSTERDEKTELLRQRNEQLNEKLKHAQDKLGEMEQNEDIPKLRRQIADMKKNITELMNQKKEMDESLNVIVGETVHKLILLQSINNTLTARNKQLLDDVTVLTTKLNQTEIELEECLNQKPNNVSNETDELLLKNITELMKENEELTAKLQNLTEQLHGMQCVNDVGTLHVRLAEATRNISRLTEDNKKLNLQYGHLMDWFNRAHEQHVKEKGDLEKNLASGAAKTAQLSRDNAALNKTLNESSQQLEALRKKCAGTHNATHEPEPVDLVEQIKRLLQENRELINQATNASCNVGNSIATNPNITESQLIELVNNASRLLGEKEQLRNELNAALQQIAALSGASNGSSSNGNGPASSKGASDSLPSSCAEALQRAGNKAASGVQQLLLPGLGSKPFYVYCLKDPEGGAAWTVVQRRADNSTDFYRDWLEYKQGFGNLRNEFFIGLDKLNALTQAHLQELRIEMVDFDNETRYASYDNFAIGDEDEQYALNILGAYEGNAGDSLRRQQGQKFSTLDNDNDLSDENCAQDYLGAWWYEACQDSNLNGVYLVGDLSKDQYGQGIVWNDWRGQYYSLKSVYMAIRPKV